MKKFFLIIFLFSCAELKAQDTLFTLEKILSQVEENFPDIQKYADRSRAIEARIEGAGAWMPPTVSFGADRFPYDLKMLSSEEPMNQAGIMLSLQQMIPNPAKIQSKKNYLESLKNIEEKNSLWTKNELRTLAKNFFYQRVVAEKTQKIIRQNEDLLRLLISTAEGRYQYSQSDITTVYKAKARLEELKNMSLMQESAIAESNIALNTLLQRNISLPIAIDTNITLKNFSSEEPLSGRSDIAAMQAQIRSMQRQSEYMASQSYPDFGVEFRHMQMFGMPNQFSVMGMMTLPFLPWSAPMYSSDVRAMEYEVQAMQKEISSMRLMAERMAKEKFSMMSYASRQLENFRRDVLPSFEKNFEANLIAYRQNTGNFFALLDAWEMLLMKRMEEMNLLREVLRLQTEYERETEQ